MSNSTSTTPGPAAGCVTFASLFQDTLLEEPVSSNAPAQVRRQAEVMQRQAASLCRACPLMVGCLYDAIVRHDVSGYAGGTTRRQRLAIRDQLKIAVAPEDLDTLAGVTGRNRQVDPDEVSRVRQANPQESLESLARRLGCSLSTVKRHLRQTRTGASATAPVSSTPSRLDVLNAYARVTGSGSVASQAA